MKTVYWKRVLALVLLFSATPAFAASVSFRHSNIFSSTTNQVEKDVGSSCRTLLKHLGDYAVIYSENNGVPSFSPDPKSYLFFDGFVKADAQHYVSLLHYRGADGIEIIVPVLASPFLGSSATVSFGSCQTIARLY